jgi:hypothetical protein
MSERHCTIAQRKTEVGLQRVLTLGGIAISFDAFDRPGRNAETGQEELPESVGLRAEKRPRLFTVAWKDGPVPSIAPARLARQTLTRRPDPFTQGDIRSLAIEGAINVAEEDIPAIAAFHRYLHAQAVFPYGNRPVPPPGTERMLDRFMGEERAKARALEADPDAPTVDPEKVNVPPENGPDNGDSGASAESARGAAEGQPGNKPAAKPPGEAPKGKKSHYQRRKADLLGMAEAEEGGDALRQICQTLGIQPSANKRDMASDILAKEFPNDHKEL